MSNDLDFGRLYKGEEYQIDIQIPYVGETFDSFELKFFTDSATTFDVPSTQYTVSSSTVNVDVNEHDLDVLADGVLRYYIEYVVNGVTTILCTNTMHYLKTPDGYSGQTAQDIYYEGYEAGLNAAGGEYADGYNEGVSVQKSRLSSIVITENNTYTRADGYSAVTVNVPQTGSTFIAQTKNYNITQNGNTSISPDFGYDGITGGTISVNVPQTGHTDAEITAAYNSGYTAGEADGEVTGAAAQKALLVSTAITENGVYTRENGYNSVNVSIAQTGHTDAELEAAYTSGYTGGEIAGIAEQKALLTSITATTNNTYSTENGYGTVVVNVPQNLRPAYQTAGVCKYQIHTPVYPNNFVHIENETLIIAMYLNDGTPVDLSGGGFYFQNTGSTVSYLDFTLYVIGRIDSDIMRSLDIDTQITSMTFYGNVMYGQSPNETPSKPLWTGTTLDITSGYTGMCRSDYLLMTNRCGFSNVERINFDVPLAWVYDYTSMSFPQCSSIYLNGNTTYCPAYGSSYSTIKFSLKNTGTLYCKQSIYDNLAASGFWSHFPTGWTISPTL